MCILDGKAYSALEESGRDTDLDDVETCIIATNNQVCSFLRALPLQPEMGSGEREGVNSKFRDVSALRPIYEGIRHP